jgi:hypothetical protein
MTTEQEPINAQNERDLEALQEFLDSVSYGAFSSDIATGLREIVALAADADLGNGMIRSVAREAYDEVMGTAQDYIAKAKALQSYFELVV